MSERTSDFENPSLARALDAMRDEWTRPYRDALAAVYEAAQAVHEVRWDFPTDLDRGTGYLAAMDDLGSVLAAWENVAEEANAHA